MTGGLVPRGFAAVMVNRNRPPAFKFLKENSGLGSWMTETRASESCSRTSRVKVWVKPPSQPKWQVMITLAFPSGSVPLGKILQFLTPSGLSTTKKNKV